MKTLTQRLRVSVLGMLYLLVGALTASAQDNSTSVDRSADVERKGGGVVTFGINSTSRAVAMDVRNSREVKIALVNASVTAFGVPTGGRGFFGGDFNGSGIWYVVTTTAAPALDTLFVVDTTSGVFTPLGPIAGLAAGSNTSGLAWDYSTSTMYLCNLNAGVATLYTLNIGTLTATPVGTILTGIVIDIACSNGGQLYGLKFAGAAGVSDSLISINKTTGAATTVGPIGVDVNFAHGMDFDPVTDSLFYPGYIGGGVNNLYQINTTTGLATLVGPLAAGEYDCFSVIGAPPPPPGGTTTVTRRPNLFIPDFPTAGVRDTLTVSGVPAGNVVTRLSVSIDTLTHTWVGDFFMTLTHGSTTRTLMNRPGIGAAGSSGDNFFRTVLVDSAARRIDSIAATGVPPNGPPYTGFFRPDSGGAPTIVPSSLSPFNGSNPNGQWILFVSDNAGADTGRVRQWSLIIEYGPPVGVGEEQGNVPNGFALGQNYPNPFNPSTTIQYELPGSANVSLRVYNLMGQEVITLANGMRSAGRYDVVWNGRNAFGVQVGSGVYFYSLVAKSTDNNATFTNIKKMLFLK